MRRRPGHHPAARLRLDLDAVAVGGHRPGLGVTSPPGGMVMVANANDGLARISTCIAGSYVGVSRPGSAARARDRRGRGSRCAPRTRARRGEQAQPGDPLRALPEVQVGHDHARRAAVVDGQRAAVDLPRDPRLAAGDVGQRQVRRVAGVAERHRRTRAPGAGRPIASSVSTETPSNVMSNFDHVVTQWMAPSYVDGARAWISSHVHVVGCSTSPSTRNVHVSVARRGVTSALSTGHWSPASYWPGGSRGSRSARRRPKKPRVVVGHRRIVRRRGRRRPRHDGAMADSCTHLDTLPDDLATLTPSDDGCHECLQIGRPLGAPADVPAVRPRRLLRQLAEQARHRPPPRDRPPDHPQLRARRGLVLVLLDDQLSFYLDVPDGPSTTEERPGPSGVTGRQPGVTGGSRGRSARGRPHAGRIALRVTPGR